MAELQPHDPAKVRGLEVSPSAPVGTSRRQAASAPHVKQRNRVIRLVGTVFGLGATAWGCEVAAVAHQPVPLVVSGLTLLVLSWIGTNWEEIFAKFGDNELHIKRTQLVAEQAISAVVQVSNLPEKDPVRLNRAAKEARNWIESAAAEDRGLSDQDVLAAFERIFGTLDFVRSNGQILHVVDWDIQNGEVTVLDEQGGELIPEVRPLTQLLSDQSSKIEVSAAQDGKYQIVVHSVPDLDWTVDVEAVLATSLGVFRTAGSNRVYVYPDDWGIEGQPEWAHLALVSESIYGGERGFYGSATIVGEERSTPRRQQKAARTLLAPEDHN